MTQFKRDKKGNLKTQKGKNGLDYLIPLENKTYSFDESLTASYKNVMQMKKKYGNRKFKSDELYGYD